MTDRRRFLAGASRLMAGAAFPETLAALCVAACAPTWRAALFDADEMRALEALVDLILPATDSPAASAAMTHRFIDAAGAACATAAQQKTLREGLGALDTIAQAQHKARFAALGPEQQGALLTARAAADMALDYDHSFFKILKDYTLTGYFLSEIGATQALAYEQIPGGYDADVALAPGQKAWAI
jgi:glucoside 3-dehydrogenase (cytochrome c) hitch-hiker subunit